MQARLHAVTHRRHGLRLGEDLGILADADLQVLRPRPGRDQRLLQFQRLRRTGLQLAQVPAKLFLHLRANGVGLLRRALRLLLDDALHHGAGERHAGSLDGLQIDGRQQPRPLLIAAVLRRVGDDVGERADPLALRLAHDLGRIGGLAQVAHGRRMPRNIVDAVRAHGHDGWPLHIGPPDSPRQRARRAVLWQRGSLGQPLAHGVSPLSVLFQRPVQARSLSGGSKDIGAALGLMSLDDR